MDKKISIIDRALKEKRTGTLRIDTKHRKMTALS